MAFSFRKFVRKLNITDSKPDQTKNTRRSKSSEIRSFEAGSQSPRWSPGTQMQNTSAAILRDRDRVGDRGSYSVANSPYGASIAHALVSGICGSGHLLNTKDKAIDRRFRRWGKNATVDGGSLSGLQRSVARDVVVRGEAIVLLRYIDGRFLLQQIDPKQIDSSKTEDLGQGKRVINGIELDEFDRRVAFHIFTANPGEPFADIGESVRIDASELLHIFDKIAANQLRGISWLHPILTRLGELDQAEDAQLVRIKLAAMMAGFIRSLNGENPLGDAGANPVMEPGTLSYLPPDSDIVFSDPANVGDSPQFIKGLLKSCAAGVGLSYELASGDLSDTNYSSYRAGHLEFRRKAEFWQQELMVNQLLDPIFERWIAIEHLQGSPIDPMTEPEWLAPSWGMIDPAKEVGAEIKAVDAQLKSRREVIAGRGRDPDTVFAEIEDDPSQTEGISDA